MEPVPASVLGGTNAFDAPGADARRDLSRVPRAVPAAPERRAGGAMTMRLFEGADWSFDTLRRIHDACEEIALGELGLDVYSNQIEVITAEQMLDAYSSIGMPLFYKHWSFG